MRLFLLLFMLPVIYQAQGISFNKAYGNNDFDYGESIVQLSDSSYVIAGATSSFGSGNTDALLMGIDKNGNFSWQFTFGNAQIEWAQDILLHTNGNLYTVGYTNESGGNGYNVLLIKTDLDGTLDWLKKYGGDDWDFGYELIESEDGNIVICGETYSNTLGQNDAYALKINSENGDLIWEEKFGSTGFDGFFDLSEDGDGNLWFTGYTQQNDSNLYVVKTNQDGDEILSIIDDRAFHQVGRVIETDSNGDLLIALEHWKSNQADSIEPAYWKIDNLGTPIWQKDIPENDRIRIPESIAPFDNGDFMFTTRFIQGFSTSTSWKFNTNGSFISTGASTDFGFFFDDDFKYSTITLDNSPIHIGTTDSWGIGNSSIWVVKQGQDFEVEAMATSEQITSIEENSLQESIQFFPNPCVDELKTNFSFQGIAEYQIYDLNGRLIQKGEVQSIISVSNLRDGKYSMIIRDQNRILSTFDFLKIKGHR